MTPRTFTRTDTDYITTLVVAMATRYEQQSKGYNLIVVGEAGSDTVEIGYNYTITSELEAVPSILPKQDWRKQQVYRVTALWEEFDYLDGYSNSCEKDLGTFQSLSFAVQSIFLDIVEADLRNICDGIDYPETPVLEEM